MPRAGQINPQHWWSHTESYINDNSTYTNPVSTASGSNTLLCVFMSPKGPDRVLTTIDGGLDQFIRTFGMGPVSTYGQPLLNAYTAVSTGLVTLHCERVTAPDAAFSNVHIFAAYKTTTASEGVEAAMSVRFIPVFSEGLVKNDETSIETAIEAAESTITPDAGYTLTHLFTLTCKGRGVYGDAYRFKIESSPSADKQNSYKNYVFSIYENTTLVEQYDVVFVEDAIEGTTNMSADIVVNDIDTGSNNVTFIVNYGGLNELWKSYSSLYPNATLDDEGTIPMTAENFDAILGINKKTKKAITGYTIEVGDNYVVFNQLAGINLYSGSDGKFDMSTDAAERTAAINEAYKNAFTAGLETAAVNNDYDPYIRSRNRFPTNLILDANYSDDNKMYLASLGLSRGDCMVILDNGTDFTKKTDPLDKMKEAKFVSFNQRTQMFCPWYGKIYDPVTRKVVKVTSTFGYAAGYPLHWTSYSGKHIPLAGPIMGSLPTAGYIKNSLFPIMDAELDSTLLDDYYDNQINYIEMTSTSSVIVGSQTTRQPNLSALSEASNMFIVLDIDKACRDMVSRYPYQFMETEDIAKYNRDIELFILPDFQGQVRSISGHIDSNSWEATRGILHIYIELINRDIIKINLIEIDVNR